MLELGAVGRIFLAIGAYAAATTAIALVFWWLVKPRVMAWAQELLSTTKDTNHLVKTNGHTDPENPTIPDRIKDVAGDVKALAGTVTAHLDWSQGATEAIHDRLDAVEQALGLHPQQEESELL